MNGLAADEKTAAQGFFTVVRRDPSGHLDVSQHIVGRVRSQVALGQALEKPLQFFPSRGDQGAHVCKVIIFLVGVEALVHAVIEGIEGRNIELPDVLRFPGSEGVGVHRLDVCVGEQSEHFEALGRFHLFRKSADRCRVENVAAQH